MTKNIKFSEIIKLTSEIKERSRNRDYVFFISKENAKKLTESFSPFSPYKDILDWEKIHNGYAIGQIDGVEFIVYDF